MNALETHAIRKPIALTQMVLLHVNVFLDSPEMVSNALISMSVLLKIIALLMQYVQIILVHILVNVKVDTRVMASPVMISTNVPSMTFVQIMQHVRIHSDHTRASAILVSEVAVFNVKMSTNVWSIHATSMPIVKIQLVHLNVNVERVTLVTVSFALILMNVNLMFVQPKLGVSIQTVRTHVHVRMDTRVMESLAVT